LGEDYAFTAADAQIRFLQENVPEHAKLFVVSGGGDFWLRRLREGPHKDKVATWEIRTSLSEAEAKHWATVSAAHQKPSLVWIVFFHDGPLQNVPDPTTGRPGFFDWSFELLQILSYLVSHRAEVVYTAEDAFNPCLDEEFDGYVWPVPGPGMFAKMLEKIMYPYDKEKMHCLGKGGNKGSSYMMEHAIDLLKRQGHSGDRNKIMIIGDRFDTDIRGGLSVGIKTCLIETGCHLMRMQSFYKCDIAHFVAQDLAHMCTRILPGGSPISSSRSTSRDGFSSALLLRIWMLSQGNIHGNTGVQGLSLGECLRKFYDNAAKAQPGISIEQSCNALCQLECELTSEEVERRLTLLGHTGKLISFKVFSVLVRDALNDLGHRPQSPPFSSDSRAHTPDCSPTTDPAVAPKARVPPTGYFLPMNVQQGQSDAQLDCFFTETGRRGEPVILTASTKKLDLRQERKRETKPVQALPTTRGKAQPVGPINLPPLSPEVPQRPLPLRRRRLGFPNPLSSMDSLTSSMRSKAPAPRRSFASCGCSSNSSHGTSPGAGHQAASPAGTKMDCSHV